MTISIPKSARPLLADTRRRAAPSPDRAQRRPIARERREISGVRDAVAVAGASRRIRRSVTLMGGALTDGTGDLVLTRIRAGREVAIARRLVAVGSDLVTLGARLVAVRARLIGV
jgi:hypothetical protein